MSGDLITFISGRIPLGFALPILAGVFACFVWWVVWTGTQFWEKRLLWKNFARIWIILLAAYMTAWFLFPPPPIPRRVLVVESAPDSSEWRVRGVAEMIRDGLQRTRLPFVLLDEESCLGLRSAPDEESYNRLALDLKIKWIVRISASENNNVSITIRKKASRAYQTFALLNQHVEFFRRDGAPLAAEALQVIGEKRPPAIAPFLPHNLPDSLLAVLFSPPGQSDSTAAISAERLSRLTETYPDWQAARLLTAKCLMRAGFRPNLGKILLQLQEAGRLDARDPETMTLLGRTFLEYRLWDQAESALKLSYSLNPDDPRTLFYLSRLDERQLGDLPFKSGLKLLRRALYLNAGYEDARLELARFYMRRRDKQLAQKVLIEGLKYNPHSVLLRQSLTAALIETGKTEEAARICRKIIAIDPDYAPAYYNLGIAYIYLERFEEGLAALDSSLARGGTVDNLYYKGVAYQRMGEWEKAVKEFQRRLASPVTSDDKVAISARERVKMLRRWIAERDSGKTN